jgi:hypothetical protein
MQTGCLGDTNNGYRRQTDTGVEKPLLPRAIVSSSGCTVEPALAPVDLAYLEVWKPTGFYLTSLTKTRSVSGTKRAKTPT